MSEQHWGAGLRPRVVRGALPPRAIAGLFLLAACQSEPPSQPTDESFPTMTVALGDQMVEVPFEEVKCTESDSEQTIELLSASEASARILIARVRGNDVVEAHVFVPNVTLGEFDYDMLHIVAADVDGAATPDCRVERAEQLELVCNNTTVLPWLAAGERPNPSFKATFSCP